MPANPGSPGKWPLKLRERDMSYINLGHVMYIITQKQHWKGVLQDKYFKNHLIQKTQVCEVDVDLINGSHTDSGDNFAAISITVCGIKCSGYRPINYTQSANTLHTQILHTHSVINEQHNQQYEQ